MNAPTIDEYLSQPQAPISGVYRSVNTLETEATLPLAELEPQLVNIVERAAGTIATGRAVGMASLPEEYRDQQLHKFAFTAQEYAAFRAYQADTLRRLDEQFPDEEDDEEDEDDPRRVRLSNKQHGSDDKSSRL